MTRTGRSLSFVSIARRYHFNLRLVCLICAGLSVFGLLAVRPFSLVNARRQPFTPIAQSATSAQGFAALLAKAQTAGSVRIIVMLRVAFRPEGLLTNTPDVLFQ